MSALASRLAWVERDGRLIIVTRALRTFAQSSATVVIAIYLGLRSFGLIEIGLFLTLGSAGVAASAVLVGALGDGIGRRRTLMALASLMALTGLTLAMSDDFIVLGCAAFLGGFSAQAGSGGGMGILEQSILADAAPSHRRTDVFALTGVVATAAGSLGALASGLPTAVQLSLGTAQLFSFRVLFLMYAAFGLTMVALYSRLSVRAEPPDGAARWINPMRTPSRRRIFTLAGLFAVDSFGTGLAVESLASYWFFTRFGLQPGELGAVFFASSLLTAVSLWVAVRLARRIGLVNTMVFTHIPSSLCLVAMMFAPFAWLAISFWLLRAFLGQMDVPTSQSYTMAVVGAEERTVMASATTVSRSTGAAIGPTVATALWSTTSAAVPFIAGALIKITYDLTLWTLFRRVTPPEEAVLDRRTR